MFFVFFKFHWKSAKNKLRKSLLESWNKLKEEELNPILQEVDKYGDIKELINNAKNELETGT